MPAVTLPVHCSVCGKPVTLEYVPHPVLGDALESDNEYPCPHCWATVAIRLPGKLTDSWSGHGSDPDAA